jgi:hypothetical protein
MRAFYWDGEAPPPGIALYARHFVAAVIRQCPGVTHIVSQVP